MRIREIKVQLSALVTGSKLDTWQLYAENTLPLLYTSCCLILLEGGEYSSLNRVILNSVRHLKRNDGIM
jgi:hypothetical protein